jgi:hypothetical protein
VVKISIILSGSPGQMTDSSRLHPRRSSWPLLLAAASQLFFVRLAANELPLPSAIDTVEDGRATIANLYQAFSALGGNGWALDVIARSQPEGTGQAAPIIALRTLQTGPAIWIISGIHGEEPAGPNAIARVIDAIAETGSERPVVFIPLANPHGYARNWRYLNTPTWSEDFEAQSVGDSSHLLVDPAEPSQARVSQASSPEAAALTQYVLEAARDYPPIISIDLHEDDKISEGYVYSQGSKGAAEPLAHSAVDALRASGVAIKMSGETRFEEPIEAGIIGPVTDSSIDELMSAGEIMVEGAISAGPAAHAVLVIETPAAALPLSSRITAQASVLERILTELQQDPD